jgi:molybdenum cofactor guanylyltransferase/molybdopterin-guanine dinucleotide biosynthesis protein MobB
MDTEAIAPQHIVGIVLAGGQGQRMGGVDKALQPLGDKPLIGHVIQRIAPQVRTLAISANGDRERLSTYGLPVLADPDDLGIGPFPGPLAGLLAGLRWAMTLRPEPRWLLTVPTDTPFLPWSLVHALSRAKMRVALARSDSGLQPTCALWPVNLAGPLAEFLLKGGRSIRDWCKAIDANGAPSERTTSAATHFGPILVGRQRVDPFFNINDPDQLALAARWTAPRQAVLGVAGWKNSGKTTLTERLVAEIVRRGLSVSTLKHAHHSFDVDHAGTDSFRHRLAGAREVAIVSQHRFALMHELGDAPEPDFDTMLGKLAPSDLVLAEGYKSVDIPKIETRADDQTSALNLAEQDGNVIAIAASGLSVGAHVPVFHRDATSAIADFIVQRFDLR